MNFILYVQPLSLLLRAVKRYGNANFASGYVFAAMPSVLPQSPIYSTYNVQF